MSSTVGFHTMSPGRPWLVLAFVTLAACSKGSDDTPSASSASGGTAAATATAAKKPKATLKLADIKSAYKSEVDNVAKMKDPMDKKIGAFVAKIGSPAADTGRKKTWYALDGNNCSKVELDTKDGSLADMTTDKSDCGM